MEENIFWLNSTRLSEYKKAIVNICIKMNYVLIYIYNPFIFIVYVKIV